MNTATTVMVEYVGQKVRKEDNVAGTGTVWNGAGDVQEVPQRAWAIMQRHKDVWREASADASTSSLSGQPQGGGNDTAAGGNAAPQGGGNDTAAGGNAAPQGGASDAPSLHAMTSDELFALATQRDLKPHHRAGKPALLKLLGA